MKMENISVILDLWNWYIKWAVIAKEEGRTVVLAKEMVKTKWMRKWKILDIDDFVFSINSVFDSFTKKLWWDFLDDVYVWISHPYMFIKRVSEQKRILDAKVDKSDLDHISDLLESSGEANYETIKIIPVQWIIDDNIKLKDPIWMEGKKLELLADVFMVPKNFYNSIVEAFQKLELGEPDLIPNILWATEIALDLDSRDLGTLLIDIWNNQTTYVVYEEWYPLSYGVIPIWAEDVTKDISIWLQVDIKEAEKIKREKWIILFEEERMKDETIDVWFLSDIVAARYEEIFEKINQRLIDLWRDWKLPGWVVLIWGWSKITNLDRLAKNIFKLAVFYWKDKVLNIWDLSWNQQFLSLLWVYVWWKKYWEVNSGGFNFKMNFSFINKITKFLKDLF